MSDPQLRLIVYRESVGLPRLRWPCGDEEQNPILPERADANEWHEEVYVWTLGREQVISALSSKLTQEFGEGVPRIRRRPSRLREVAVALSAETAGEWSVSMEPQEASDPDLPPVMANASAALVQHLNWVADTFADLPGAHIVVR